VNQGYLIKTIRECWFATAIFALAIFVFEMLLAVFLATFQDQLSAYWLQVEIIEVMFRGLVGIETDAEFSPVAINALPWVHPVILTTIWAHEIIFCTRMPVGEIDRGTIDLLFGLPLSRKQVYLNESVVWLFSGAFVILMGVLGNRVTSLFMDTDYHQYWSSLLIVIANLYCLYIAVGGLACLVSSLGDRRGRAVSIVFGIVLVSFFLNFLAQSWAPAGNFAYLSVLHYYRPAIILRDVTWPVADMLVLFAIGAVCWFIGGLVFSRRDICTL